MTTKIQTTEKTGPYAVIATGGKQYVVREGDYVKIERMNDKEYKVGDTITFDSVLLTDNGSTTKVGTPTVAGAKVTGELVEIARAKKVVVIRYKSKSNYFNKNGHRQPFFNIKITSIA